MRIHSALAGAFAVLVAGCGARAAPMVPLRTVPPPMLGAQISQLGTGALIRFLPIAEIIDLGNDKQMEIARAEILMLTERYPALTASILAQGLDRARVERLELARHAAELATESAAARRRAEDRLAAEAAAAEAGIELPPEDISEPEEEPAEEEEPITEEQLLLNRLPGNVLREWRKAGIAGHVLVEAARWFDEAVNELWDLLGMPTAIVDTRRPPQLPLPSLIVEKAAQLARTHPYEGSLEVADFLTRAAVVAVIPFGDINSYMVNGRARIDYNIGTSSSGPVRTRYYFATRAVDTEGNEGRIDTIMALAPDSVPLAPADLKAEVTPNGTQLDWSAPAGDVWGNIVDSDQIRYNIYRRIVDSDIVALTPINYAPIPETEYLDSTMSWGEQYLYEVRAVTAPPSASDTPLLVEPEPAQPVTSSTPGIDSNPTNSLTPTNGSLPAIGDPVDPTLIVAPIGPIKESSGVLTPPVYVVDTFKPDKLIEVEAVRAAMRITLRWSPSYDVDLVGYRVYRRQLIDDPCDSRYIPDDDGESESDESDESPAGDDNSVEPDCQNANFAESFAGNTPEANDIAQANKTTADEVVDDTIGNETDGLLSKDTTSPSENDGVSPDDENSLDDQDGHEEAVGETADKQSNDAVEDTGSGKRAANDGAKPARETSNRRRRGNELVNNGWELLTAVVISDVRYTDPTASHDIAWEFAVEVVDDSGNVSEPAVVKVRLHSEAEVQ